MLSSHPSDMMGTLRKRRKTWSNAVKLSKQVRRNWLLDASLFLLALAAILSGVYFLLLCTLADW
jgi:hypothetical protein